MPRRISNRLAQQMDGFKAGAVTHLNPSCGSGLSRSLMLGAFRLALERDHGPGAVGTSLSQAGRQDLGAMGGQSAITVKVGGHPRWVANGKRETCSGVADGGTPRGSWRATHSGAQRRAICLCCGLDDTTPSLVLSGRWTSRPLDCAPAGTRPRSPPSDPTLV